MFEQNIWTEDGTHVAEFLHVCHQQGEAVSEGRVILRADLLDEGAQQHLTVVRDGQDRGQLDRRVTQCWHHRSQQTAARRAEVRLLNVLDINMKVNVMISRALMQLTGLYVQYQ